MARSKKKSKAKKKNSHTPAVRHLRFRVSLPIGVANNAFFFDISKNLSGVNRRLYRQGKHYFIKKVSVSAEGDGNCVVRVSTAPNSWMLSSAWKMGRTMFNKMRLAHGGAPGSGLPASVTPATWADFKVYLSADHKTSGDQQAIDIDGNGVVVNEWRHSIFTAPDIAGGGTADQYDVKLLGNHDGGAGSRTCVALIDAYAESRRTVQVDDTGDEMVAASPWIQLFDDGETLDEVLEEIKVDGDEPPYDLDVYTGLTGNMPSPIVVGEKTMNAYQPTDFLQTVTFGGFQAPCGLIRLDVVRPGTVAFQDYEILIEVSEGSYKGVKALDL